jgi:signal transduction histidine kinase/CheY-like chemotaxis protein
MQNSTVSPASRPAATAAADLDFEALLRSIPVPVVVYDVGEGEPIHFVSPTFTETFGYAREDVPTLQHWAQQAYPDPMYRDRAMRELHDLVSAQSTDDRRRPSAEYRILDKAGLQRNVLIGFALQGSRVIVTLQDISRMREVEATLAAERESTAYALTENMPAGAYTMLQGPGEAVAQFAFLSRQFLEMLDLTRAEATGDPATAFSRVHPDDHARWLALNIEAFARKTRFSGETRAIVHGATKWFRAESIPRTLPDGSTLWEGIVVDITRLKETEERLQGVIDAARAITWSLDLRTRQIQFNTARAVAHGDLAETRGSSLDDWLVAVHPDDALGVRDLLERLRTGQAERHRVVHRRKADGGQWLWFQMHAGVSARDLGGLPTMVSGVSFDITADIAEKQVAQEVQAELREELQRAQQSDTMAQVAEGVAHDLNNLIAVISGTAELLEIYRNSETDLRDGISRIRRAVGAAQDLVAGLERLVRPNRPRSLHDIGSLLADAVELLGSRRVARHGIRTNLPEAPPSIWANPTDLAQVIVNLAINACDSGVGDDVAAVELTVLPAGSAPPQRPPDAGSPMSAGTPVTVFAVSDTGGGIPDEVRARMFRPHFTTKGEAGTGLGLLIVSTILQSNRAGLWIDTQVGAGTTITVAWPAEPPEQDGTHLPDPGHPNGRDIVQRAAESLLEGLNVLVVDDMPDVGGILADMLEAAGAISLVETHPHEAQKALAESPGLWSVLVTDLHMPDLDGRAMARFAARVSPPVPVVLVTARGATLAAADRPLFAEVLSKPVTSMELIQAVSSAARRRMESDRVLRIQEGLEF